MTNTIEKTLLDNMLAMRNDIGRIGEIVRRHDQETFPDIQRTLVRIESKHNQDYLQYIESKEALETRIEPIEKDYVERQKEKEENRENIREYKVEAGKTVIQVVVGSTISIVVTIYGLLKLGLISIIK